VPTFSDLAEKSFKAWRTAIYDALAVCPNVDPLLAANICIIHTTGAASENLKGCMID